MSFEGIGRIFSQKLGDVRKGEQASREGIKNQSPLNRLNNTRYSKADGFTGRSNKANAGQVHALHHAPKGLDKKLHSANSARGQRVLKNLIFETNPVELDDGSEPKQVNLKTVNSRQGHSDLANLFKAAGEQRSDQAL